MPVDKEKSSSYLRYRKSLSETTYSKIKEVSMVPEATMSAYFNGTVKNPSRETFEKLMNAVGGSWDEYDEWTPDVKADLTIPKNDPNIEHMQKAFESSAMRMEAAFNASLSRMETSHDKEIERLEKRYNEILWTQRVEKYILIGMVLLLAGYAIFSFSHMGM